MAIFIGDRPAQAIKETGQIINQIQNQYENEKLRREAYTDQFDAAEADYASLNSKFKPILNGFVSDILKAQVDVEENNTPEARERLRSLSREYESVKAIAEAQSEMIAKGFVDARNNLYVEDVDSLKEQVNQNLSGLEGMSHRDFLKSKFADSNFLAFQATPYDKSIEGMNIQSHVNDLLKIYDNRRADLYDNAGRLKMDELSNINDKFVDMLFKAQPQLLKSAATRYANKQYGKVDQSTVNEILSDESLLSEPRNEFARDIIETAGTNVSSRIILKKEKGKTEKPNKYIVREKGFSYEGDDGGDVKIPGKYIRVDDKGIISLETGLAYAGDLVTPVSIVNFIQSLDDKELTKLKNTIDLDKLLAAISETTDEDGRRQSDPQSFVTDDMDGKIVKYDISGKPIVIDEEVEEVPIRKGNLPTLESLEDILPTPVEE